MKKSSLIPTLVLAGATSLAAMLTPVAAKAVSVTYNVNRSWSQSGNNASLVGTVAVPLGNYTLQPSVPIPFTSVNLTLTVNGSPFTLNAAYNGSSGDGKFLINATSSELMLGLLTLVRYFLVLQEVIIPMESRLTILVWNTQALKVQTQMFTLQYLSP
jgi:hypothetical protein